ncbi:unnamed protein product [Moneuplotes crassus]|uniref:Uncharacterized protein n=1 Tax=Euplotes crassus TaxID=5936 RepID=A0AAD2DAK9_EUPCR|nr:unnamed protein product [Moneuplotes crassus]
MDQFRNLSCQLIHCGKKAKHYVTYDAIYVCGCCKKLKYFDGETVPLVDPEEIQKSLDYVKFNLEGINEPGFNDRWDGLQDFIDNFEQRVVQGEARLKELVDNLLWTKMQELETQIDSLVQEFNSSELFRTFLHYINAENIRQRANGILPSEMAIKENNQLRRQLEKMVREKVELQRNCRDRLTEQENINDELVRQRDQLANDLEISQARVQELETVQQRVNELENTNAELDRSLVRHQTERQEHITQIDHLKNIYDKLTQNISKEVDALKKTQKKNHKATTQNIQTLKENIQADQAKLKEEFKASQEETKESEDNSPPKKKSLLEAEMEKNPKCREFAKKMASSKSFNFDLRNKVGLKVMELADAKELSHLEEIRLVNVGCVDEKTFHNFTSKIPHGLKDLALNFSPNGYSAGSITAYLPSILPLQSKLTGKICFDCTKISESEEAQIGKAFKHIKVEYYNPINVDSDY